jgi:hypothetical protein
MSIYFPKPLYEPDEIALSLVSTLTLRYNEYENKNVETHDLDYETYYRPDSGGEEVLVDFDVPVKTPQTMNFVFPKGFVTMTHCLRVSIQAKLFPDDRSKRNNKTVVPCAIR